MCRLIAMVSIEPVKRISRLFGARLSPLLVRRGGRAIKKKSPFRIGADGGRSPRKPDRAQPSRKVVAHRNMTCSDHPVCGAKVGFAEIFLMPQTPLLTRRGICLFQFVDS